jgi:hypothetical protein
VQAPDLLVARIRGEYREMPGLRLTFAQACRLWQVEQATCRAVLDRLLHERFLLKTPDGSYVAMPPVTPAMRRMAPAARPVPVLRGA